MALPPFGHSYRHTRPMIASGAISPEHINLLEDFILKSIELNDFLHLHDDKMIWLDTAKSLGIKYNSTTSRIVLSADVECESDLYAPADIWWLETINWTTTPGRYLKWLATPDRFEFSHLLRLLDNLDMQNNDILAIATAYAQVVEGSGPDLILEGDDIYATLGDALGANKMYWRNSALATILELDSLGAFKLFADINANLFTISGLPAAIASGQPVRYDEFIALQAGLTHKKKVIDIVDCTLAPPTEVSGDRYILDFTVGTVHANWDGAAKGDIVDFNGTLWDASSPVEGWTAYIDAINRQGTYIDDGIPTWELAPVTFPDHNDVLNIQGGTALERYHLTLVKHTEATRDATVAQNGLCPTNHIGNPDGHHPQAHGADHVDGTQNIHPIITVAFGDSPYTAVLSTENIMCNATGGAITVNLPTAVGNSGKIYNVKKIDSSANTVTIDANGTETIDKSLTKVLNNQNESLTLISDNVEWWIL